MGAAGLQDSQPLQQWGGGSPRSTLRGGHCPSEGVQKAEVASPAEGGCVLPQSSASQLCLRGCGLGPVCSLELLCVAGAGGEAWGGMEGGRERGRRATGGRTPGAQPGSTSTFI